VARLGHSGPVPGPVADAFTRALEGLEGGVGLPVEAMEPEDLLRPGEPDADWVTWTGPELVTWLGRERAEAALDLMFPNTRAFVEAGMRTSEDEYRSARRRVADHARSLDAVLDGDTLIASPTLAVEGWLPEGQVPGSEEPDPPSEAFNTTVQNLTGHPAITVPAGRFVNGVPFGLQLTGPGGGDAMLLEVAEDWERSRPWPVIADGYEPFEP
jgi:Asp-tRNA(Asn)/Glu-tRNA(Gln) amidotransferase A subunit family amidase